MANSDIQFKKGDENILTPEKIIEHYNLYLQYIEDSINYGNEYKLQLDVYNINNYYRHSDWTKLSKRKKKQIPYYLEIPIPPKILPISLRAWMNKFIPCGGWIILCLEDKMTLKRMNIIIRTGGPNKVGGIEEYYKIHNIVFKEGYFLYDFCLNNFGESVSLNKINTLIRNPNMSESNVVLDFGIRDSLINFVYNYSVRVSNYDFFKENEISNYDIPERVTIEDTNSYSFYSEGNSKIYINYSNDSVPIELVYLEIKNRKGEKMLIFIRIFKRIEDKHKNQITLSDFHFKKGCFYFNMESYKRDLAQKDRTFIDNFDMNNIEDFRITDDDMKKLIK